MSAVCRGSHRGFGAAPLATEAAEAPAAARCLLLLLALRIWLLGEAYAGPLQLALALLQRLHRLLVA